MRVLCGTDIIEVSRIKQSIERTGETFLNIIYTPADIEYCESKRNAKFYHYAGRFADWDYMWTDQSFLSGKKLAEKLAKQILGE